VRPDLTARDALALVEEWWFNAEEVQQ